MHVSINQKLALLRGQMTVVMILIASYRLIMLRGQMLTEHQ
ncbi:hypothetical protein [Pokkaliibacter plantistimulans]|nr:hypothetical protein [Pokkaliibacter plantistimulans]